MGKSAGLYCIGPGMKGEQPTFDKSGAKSFLISYSNLSSIRTARCCSTSPLYISPQLYPLARFALVLLTKQIVNYAVSRPGEPADHLVTQ